MIVRHTNDGLLLIAQHEHALLSGRLAAHWCDVRSPLPEPIEEAIAGIAQHDSGWPLLDHAPRINPLDNAPADFMHMNSAEYLTAWRASAENAIAFGPLAAYLVSAHSRALAAFSLLRPADPAESTDWRAFVTEQNRRMEQIASQADWNHRQIAAADDALPILQQLDRLSLILCCDRGTIGQAPDAPWSQANRKLPLELEWRDETTLIVHPWPFARSPIEETVPARRLARRTFTSDAALRRSFEDAEVHSLSWQLLPRG